MSAIPCDVELERYVLAQLIDCPESYWSAETLSPESFYLDSHRTIYRALRQMIADSKTIDHSTLADQLGYDTTRSIGGMSYLLSLSEGFVPTSDLPSWAAILREKQQLRRLIVLADGLSHRCQQDDANPYDIVSSASNTLESVFNGHRGKSLEEHSVEEFEILQRERKGERVKFLPSGLVRLDEIHGGYARGEMTVVGGRPAQGKTVILSQAVMELCPKGVPCKLYEMEMKAGQILRRIWCGKAKIPAHKLRHPNRLSDGENNSLAAVMTEVSSWPLEIDDTSALSVEDLVMKTKASVRRNKAQFVGVDYLQKLKFPGNLTQRFQAVTDAAVQLARLAKDENLALVVLSSLTTKNGKNRNDPPTLSDLRMSGDIEYEASTALLIHREVDEDTERLNNAGQIIIAKGRSDEGGVFNVEFSPSFLTFL